MNVFFLGNVTRGNQFLLAHLLTPRKRRKEKSKILESLKQKRVGRGGVGVE